MVADKDGICIMGKKRSVGVFIVGIIVTIIGLLSLGVISLIGFASVVAPWCMWGNYRLKDLKTWAIFFICLFISGFFILKLKEWARILLIGLSITCGIIVFLFTVNIGIWILGILCLFLLLLLIFFLTRLEVREQFK